MSDERSFEAAQEGFTPVSDSERGRLLEHAWELLVRNGDAGFEHLSRPAALGLCSKGSGHLLVQAMERMDSGEVYTTVEVADGGLEHIGRIFLGDQGALDLNQEANSGSRQPMLRHGDLDLMEELYQHPERFVDYNFDDGPSWTRTRAQRFEFLTESDPGDFAD